MAEETAVIESETSTAEKVVDSATDTSKQTINGDLIDTNENTPVTPPKETFLKDVYLPDEIRNDPTIKNLEGKSVTDLAKMMLNGQKAIGADKFSIPADDAPEEEWETIFKKMGRPESPDLYNLKQPEDFPEGLYNEEIAKEYGDIAFKLGLTAKQAAGLSHWHNSKALSGHEAIEKAKEEALDAGRDALESEWGNAFDDKCRLANSVLRNTKGGEEVKLALKEHGLGNDPRILKWLANTVGPTVGEDRLIGLDASSKNRTSTPEAAKNKLVELRSRAGYADKYHVEHDQVMNEYQAALKDAYPEDNVA